MNAPVMSFSIMPGSWLGIVGGGQLGRMFCHAAQSLGYKVAVLDPSALCPAGVVANLHIRAAYDDQSALSRLSEQCLAVTTEFENVPALSLKTLAQHCQVSPDAQAVAITQDRIQEKAFIAESGAPVVPYAPIYSVDDLRACPDVLFPGVLKAARLGYDGKGQARVQNRQQAIDAFANLNNAPCVLEAFVPLDFEISVVIARGFDGVAVAYTPAANEHRNGILAVSTVVGETAQGRAHAYAQATEVALVLARKLDYFGVLCVEFFVLSDGSLIVNEIAPRPHNSGHYTINACITSQFEQQVRVMTGMPLGSPACLCPSIMLNILGDIWFDPISGEKREPNWIAALEVPNAKLHLYDKLEARHGRKMGHVTVLGATLGQARDSAAQVAAALGIAF